MKTKTLTAEEKYKRTGEIRDKLLDLFPERGVSELIDVINEKKDDLLNHYEAFTSTNYLTEESKRKLFGVIEKK